MSNKKVLQEMTLSEAKAAGVSSLSDRPNQASRYGDGGRTAKALKERFDALPNLVREKFNIIARTLATEDASKYVTIGVEGDQLGETLYDVLLLFGKRGTGLTDRNISDYIELLYQMKNDSTSKAYPLPDIINDLYAKAVAVKCDSYTKEQIDAMFGSYVTDIDTLIGGES